MRAGCWLVLVLLSGIVHAASFDDPLQAQRFNAVVAQLADDVPPEQGFPAIFDYMGFYEWVGYSDPAEFDDLADIEETFGSAYTGYVQRLQDRLNERLGNCDPTVVEEALDFLDFFESGYGPVTPISSNRERFENSVFWAGYLQWEVNDALRDLIDKPGDGPVVTDFDPLINVLVKGRGEQRDDAARALGLAAKAAAVSVADAARLTRHSHSVVRYFAVQALSTLAGSDRSAAQSATAALGAALQDHSWPVRLAAAEALSSRDGRRAREAQALLDHVARAKSLWPTRQSLHKR